MQVHLLNICIRSKATENDVKVHFKRSIRWRQNAQFGCSFICSSVPFLCFPNFPNVMELHFSHALCSLPRQKLWILEIHHENQQSYCQTDLSCISFIKEFLTSHAIRYSRRQPVSDSVSAWAGYMSGIGLA